MAAFIRPACADDLPIVYQFVCELESQLFDLEIFKCIFLNNIQHPDRHYLVAFEQDQAIGYGSIHAQELLHHCGKVGEIQEMYVVPESRSLGVGKLLVEALIAIAQREQYVNIEVTSNKKRPDAHRFYVQNGFTDSHLKFVRQLT